MARHTRTPVPMPKNSRANIRTGYLRRHRAQSAARSPAGLCPGGSRRRQFLIGANARQCRNCRGLQLLHKTIHHALFARLVEGDGELVAVHGDHVAVAEFLVKHALADREG